MVMWPDHKTKKRSAYEISLWFCNLWFPLHICSVSLVSLSYHEPPASFFWLLILWVILSWIPLMSPKYLNGSSHISPLQIRSTSYLLFYHNRILSSSFLVLQSYLCLAAVILRSFIFLLLKCIWEQQRCPFSPMHNLRLHLQKTDLHKKDSLHDINAARHQSLCKVPHFKNHPTNQQFLKFGLNYMHWALWKVRPDLCWMCTLIKHRECGVLTILCSVKMYLCW